MQKKDELRQQLVETWREFQESVVDDATDQWRIRLEACFCPLQMVIISKSTCDICETIFHTTPLNNRFFSEPSTFPEENS